MTGCSESTKKTAQEPAKNTAKEQSASTGLVFGAPSIGSVIHTLSVGLADLVTKNTNLNITVESIGGADANVRAMRQGKIDGTIASGYILYHGREGTLQFEGEGKTPMSLIAQGQPSLRQIVVRADSGISTPKDLEGKIFIARRKSNSEIEMLADALFKD